MVRLVFALAALLLVTQLSGLSTLVAEAAGVEECSDEAADGDCPPDCGTCACCPHWKASIAAPAVTIVPPGMIVRVWIEIRTALTSADPREIVHVPKRLA